MAVPDRIAMCAHPDGPHEHVPLRDDEPAPTTCFMDCDCTPVVFVREAKAMRELLRRTDACMTRVEVCDELRKIRDELEGS